MEILFMVFMIVVCALALFAIVIVLRDIILTSDYNSSEHRIKAYAERLVNEAQKKANASEESPVAPAPAVNPMAYAAAPAYAPIYTMPAPAPVPAPAPAVVEVSADPAPAPVALSEAPVAEEATEGSNVTLADHVNVIKPIVDADGNAPDKADYDVDDPENSAYDSVADDGDDYNIKFNAGQRQTIDEKYMALTSEQKKWYDQIIKYASAQEGSKRFKNQRYEEYKVGNNRIVRMLIKRGVINCEFILHNSDFKNYVNENKISVRQSATTMIVDSAATVEAAKNSIDIVMAAVAEEREYKKKLARERRRAAKAAAEAAAEAAN